jgi:hypothetical protein
MSLQSNLIVSVSSGSELFFATKIKSLIKGVEFLDQEIKAQKNRDENLAGAGVYGLFYQDQLIYVGKFKNGNKGTPFAGNVAKAQWWTHIASMTMRGRKVSVSTTSLRELRSKEIESSLVMILDPVVESHMVKDRGCSSGLRRVLFALEHWNEFEHADMNSLLSFFSFCYIRIPFSNEDPAIFRKKIGSAENKIIAMLKPRCNKETPIGKARACVFVDEFIDCAKQELFW